MPANTTRTWTPQPGGFLTLDGYDITVRRNGVDSYCVRVEGYVPFRTWRTLAAAKAYAERQADELDAFGPNRGELGPRCQQPGAPAAWGLIAAVALAAVNTGSWWAGVASEGSVMDEHGDILVTVLWILCAGAASLFLYDRWSRSTT